MRTIMGKIVLYAAVFVFVAIAIYTVFLTFQIEKRFSGKRWNVPSRVLSDTTALFPGQHVNLDLFFTKLNNLGYHPVFGTSLKPGEYYRSDRNIDIFLKDIQMVAFQRKSYPVRLHLDGNLITDIIHRDNGTTVPYLELEPEELKLFFGPEREKRLLVSFDQIPDYLKHAVISAEDKKFYSHFGVDPAGILRALYKNLIRGKISQGGSTLTQQLAKNYFLTPERTITRKIRELIIALLIEGLFSKDEILEIYLNEIYFGQNGSVAINGVGEAAYFYFGKDVGKLSVDEAAILAGIIKAPNHFSPYADRERCRRRRDQVLELMVENHWLGDSELKTATARPVNPSGYRKYGVQAPYYMDYLARQLEKYYDKETLKSEGLTILTALDTQVQMAAETALTHGLERIEREIPSLKKNKGDAMLEGAVIVMHPRTGNIIAMVGGRNYGKSQFNRATDARRQPGSVFKPFVFLSALDDYYPSSLFDNKETTYTIDGDQWAPKNFSDKFPGKVSMRQALSFSLNLATVDLALKIGLPKILDMVGAFGFSTEMRAYPSLTLGACEVIPIELASAYCVFAGNGVLPCPLSVKQVLDPSGNIIERRHVEIQSVTTPEKAYLITSMLQSVVEEGTAKSLRQWGVPFPVAGKTGTTNDSRDAWFVGYTPDLLALVWVGCDNGSSIHSTGARAALPIWAELVKAMPAYVSEKDFIVPPGIVREKVCRESGCVAQKFGCINVEEEVFLKSNMPNRRCPLHAGKGSFDRLFNRIKELIQ